MKILAALATFILLVIAAICLANGEEIQGGALILITWICSVGIRMVDTKGLIE